MRSGLGIFLGFGVARGGGGGAPVAPIIVTPGYIDGQPLVGQSIIVNEPTVTGADSVAYQWYDGDPDVAGVAISGWASASHPPTATQYALTAPVWRKATYTNAVGSTVEKLLAPAIVKAVFTEDFSSFADGTTNATLLASGWSRCCSSTTQAWAGTIATDASAPGGKAMSYTSNSYVEAGGFRTDIDTFFGANGFQTKMSVRALIRATYARLGIRGKTVAANTSINTATGIAGGANLRFYVPCAAVIGDLLINNPAGGVMATMVSNDLYHLAMEYEGTVVRTKMWKVTDPEPIYWDVQKDGTPTVQATRGPVFWNRTTEGAGKVLWFSCAGNGDAPFWPGYVPVEALSSDPISYAAATAQTSFSQNDGAVVYNFEDM